jgi:hypothetical protein
MSDSAVLLLWLLALNVAAAGVLFHVEKLLGGGRR